MHFLQCDELYIGLLAIMKAGGCYVPVDHTLPAARVESILTQCGCQLMLTQEGVEALASLPDADKVYLNGSPSQFDAQPRTNPTSRCSVADPAYILFTSGTFAARLPWQFFQTRKPNLACVNPHASISMPAQIDILSADD